LNILNNLSYEESFNTLLTEKKIDECSHEIVSGLIRWSIFSICISDEDCRVSFTLKRPGMDFGASSLKFGKEIEETIASVDASVSKTKVSKEKTMKGKDIIFSSRSKQSIQAII
jgi:hypothetical protein